MEESTSQTQERVLPQWARLLIVGTVIGMGVFLLYLFAWRSNDSAEAVVVAMDSPRRSFFSFGPNAQPGRVVTNRPAPKYRPDILEGVSKRMSGRSVYVRSGDSIIRIGLPDKNEPLTVDLIFADLSTWLNPAQSETHRMAELIRQYESLRKKMDLTAAQLSRLALLEPTVVLAEPEKKQFEALVAVWDKAPANQKQDAEDKLMEAVKQAGIAHQAAAKAAVLKRVNEIPTFITAAQIAKYGEWGKATKGN